MVEIRKRRRDGVDGFALEAGNDDDLARRMVRSRQGERARLRTLEYTWDQCAESI